MRWRKTCAILLVCCTLLSISTNSLGATDVPQADEEGIELTSSEEDLEAHIERNGIKAEATFHRLNKQIVLTVAEEVASKTYADTYEVHVLSAHQGELVANLTDWRDGQTYRIDSRKLKASFVFVPVAVIVGEVLLAHVLAASLALVVSGITYVAVTEVAERLRKRQDEHYAAILDKKKGVYVADPLTLVQAATRLNGSSFRINNVWSTSKQAAYKVAQTAGAMRMPILDMAHGPFPQFLPHFHRFDRKGGHSFFA